MEVFDVMGERATLSLCTHDPGVCGRSSACPIHNTVWRDIDAMIEKQLSSVTLADCVDRGSASLESA